MRKRLMSLMIVGLAILLFGTMAVFVSTAKAGKPTIKHYGIVDLTGPYGILVPDVWEAKLDYYRLVDEQGGIDGYPVDLVWGETGNMMARTWSHYKKYKQSGAQLLWLASSPDGEALKNTLVKDKIFCPLNYGQSDPQLYPPAWTYIDGPSYGEGFGTFLKMAKAEWDKAGKKGTMKVGIIGPDTAYGRAALEPGQRFGKKIGVDVVGQEFVPVVPIDITPQILRLKDKGVDWIWMQGLSQIATVFMKNMASLGLQGKIPVAGFWWVTGAEMLRRIGPNFSEGYIFNSYNYLPQVEKNHPGIKKCMEMRQKYHKKAADEYYVRGVRATQFVIELTKRTLGKYGYKGLTGENYMKTMETFKNWKTPWDLGAPFDITPNDRRTAKKMLFYQVKGGKLVRYSDWIDAPHLYPDDMAKLFQK
ncbi:MAG: branched-chain amino acid transport system substrate-binding protein [bacterium]|nr:MAG: branched-chain amino acid transport system substrate-binding protein [bacterium]